MTCARSRARTALCTTARRPHRGRTNKGAGTGRAPTTNKLFTSLSLRILQSLVATQSKKLTSSNTQRWGEHPQHPPQGRSARRRFVLSEHSLMWLCISTLGGRGVQLLPQSVPLSAVALQYDLGRLFASLQLNEDDICLQLCRQR